MPSEFFNDLVAARRTGTAPGMAPEEESPGAPEDVLVVFHPAPFDGLSTCGRCLALLVTEYAPSHKAWHVALGN